MPGQRWQSRVLGQKRKGSRFGKVGSRKTFHVDDFIFWLLLLLIEVSVDLTGLEF